MATQRNQNTDEIRLAEATGGEAAGMGGEARGAVEEAKGKVQGMGERVRSRASDMVESGKGQVANRIEQLGERIEERARPLEEEGGLKGRAGRVVHRTGDALESGADYLRTHPISSIRDDVSGQIRAHPFLSVGAALGAGFVLGRIFGGGEEEEGMEERRGEPGMFDGVRRQIGRAATTGLTGLVARQVRDRVSGRPGRM